MQERKAKLKTQLIVLAFTVGAVALVWWAGPTRLSANPLSWTTEVNLSQTSNTTDPHPGIEAQDQTVYAVWIEQVQATSTAYDPLYKKSTDGGVTWASSVNISSSTNTKSANVSVAIDGEGKPHFVWAEQVGGKYDIHYRYDTASPVMITDTSESSLQPDIEVANNQAHVIWAEALSAIHYAQKGVTEAWPNPPTVENVSTSSAPGTVYSVPDIAVGGGGVVHAVWAEYSADGNQFVYYNRRTPGWGTPTNIISPTHYTSGVFDYPAIAVSGTNSIYVIYSRNAFDQSQQYVDFMRSTDGGLTWPFTKTVAGPLSANTVAPSNIVPDIAVDDQGIRAVWSGTLGGTNEIIFYGHSTDEGATWTVEQVTDNNYNRTTPAMDATPGTVHLVWARGLPSLRNAYYSRSGQSGSGGGVYLPVILKNYP